MKIVKEQEKKIVSTVKEQEKFPVNIAKEQEKLKKMSEEKKQKNIIYRLAEVIGDFLVAIIICVTIIAFFVCLAFIVMTLFENPISLAIVCLTIFLIIAWVISK